MDKSKPKGMLMTGAIGSIFMAVAWALGLTMSQTLTAAFAGGGGEASGDLVGGLGLLAIVLMFAGGIMQGIGFFGLHRTHKGANIGAGIFAILIPVSFVLIIVASVLFADSLQSGGMSMGMPVFLVATFVILFFAIAVTGVLGGLSFMGSGQGMVGRVLGIAFLVGGVVMLAMVAMGMLKVQVGITVGNILAYVIVLGLLLGNIGGAVVMLADRK